MKETDAVALNIYDDLKGSFVTNSVAHGAIGNIIGLFFHDLMIHFTGIVAHRKAISGYGDELLFPFVNKRYSQKPYRIEQLEIRASLHKSRLVEQIKRTPLVPFEIGRSIPYGEGEAKLLRVLLPLLGSVQASTKAYLPNREDQISVLLETIHTVCKKYSIGNANQLAANWLEYARLHTTDQQGPIVDKGAILGTRCDLHNRKISVNYMQQGKEVIGLTHGEVANTVFDEPIFGYADRSYCTTLIDYGNYRKAGRYNQPIVVPDAMLYRTSGVFQKMMRATDNVNPLKVEGSNLLYVPTMYSGNKLYGPFRNYEDHIYKNWQRELLQLIPNVTVKTHPKSLNSWKHQYKKEHRRLNQCLHQYDGILLDYCSTAATLSFVSDKPIVYFDIGLRNLNNEYKKDLRNRCHYVEVGDIGDFASEQKEVLREKMHNEEQRKNSQMWKYSISEDESPNILSLICKVIFGK